MVDRVLIKSGASAAMQVSLPGFDVKTATLDQLAFDARFANMNLVMSGVILVPNDTWTVVNFPTALSVVPRALVGFGPTANLAGGVTIVPQANPTTVNNPAANLTSSSGTWLFINMAVVTNSYIEFYAGNSSTDPLIKQTATCYVWYAIYR